MAHTTHSRTLERISGSEQSKKSRLLGVTLTPNEPALSLDSYPGPNTQYPTKGIGHTVTP